MARATPVQPTLNLLLVVNPTRDLEGAEEEGERIKELFGAHSSVRLVVRHQKEANKPTLLKDFSSGEYDVIHYAAMPTLIPNNPPAAASFAPASRCSAAPTSPA